MELTPNWPPYCVVLLKLKARDMGADAPSVGLKPAKVNTPPVTAIGPPEVALTAPELLNIRSCAGPAELGRPVMGSVPIVMLTAHVLAATAGTAGGPTIAGACATAEKYIVAG